MLKPRVEEMLNAQVNKELYSAYLYLSMSAYLASQSLNGYAHWFYIQAQEERDHAMIIFSYIIKAGGRAKLTSLEGPKTEFSGLEEVLVDTLHHEEYITSSIYDIVEAAHAEKDLKTVQMLSWFVDEQVEEENNANENLGRYKLMGTEGKGLFNLDSVMGSRVYTPAPQLAGGSAL